MNGILTVHDLGLGLPFLTLLIDEEYIYGPGSKLLISQWIV